MANSSIQRIRELEVTGKSITFTTGHYQSSVQDVLGIPKAEIVAVIPLDAYWDTLVAIGSRLNDFTDVCFFLPNASQYTGTMPLRIYYIRR